MKVSVRYLCGVVAIAAASVFAPVSAIAKDDKSGVPEIQREFRAAWVATVANIDWPSRKDLTVEQQKAEAIHILDAAKELNLNALIFQVRPQADAMYKSSIEPWSEYLTGEQGKAPVPFYDPLEFWCTEAHKRGIELHTWFNPYRAHHPGAKTMSEDSVVKKHPDWVHKLGKDGYYWMDPASPGVQKQSLDVVLDVVKRYDVDGVHFDDYFYPYSSYNDEKDFPDDELWAKYQASGGTMTRNDWRRDAVNKFVKSIYDGVHATKNNVLFGMSPFGIWRPQNPPGVKGLDQYDSLFADAKLWFNKGWVDYYTPQLYWPIKGDQSYTALMDWWISQNTMHRHFWPGNGTSGASTKEGARTTPQEIANQIIETRKRYPEASGNVHFSWKTLDSNKSGVTDLIRDLYKEPALIPASTWLDHTAPKKPKIGKVTKAAENTTTIPLKAGGSEVPFVYTVQTQDKAGAWKTVIISGEQATVTVKGDVTKVAVSAVDRLGNASDKVVKKIGK